MPSVAGSAIGGRRAVGTGSWELLGGAGAGHEPYQNPQITPQDAPPRARDSGEDFFYLVFFYTLKLRVIIPLQRNTFEADGGMRRRLGCIEPHWVRNSSAGRGAAEGCPDTNGFEGVEGRPPWFQARFTQPKKQQFHVLQFWLWGLGSRSLARNETS